MIKIVIGTYVAKIPEEVIQLIRCKFFFSKSENNAGREFIMHLIMCTLHTSCVTVSNLEGERSETRKNRKQYKLLLAKPIYFRQRKKTVHESTIIIEVMENLCRVQTFVQVIMYKLGFSPTKNYFQLNSAYGIFYYE